MNRGEIRSCQQPSENKAGAAGIISHSIPFLYKSPIFMWKEDLWLNTLMVMLRNEGVYNARLCCAPCEVNVR